MSDNRDSAATKPYYFQLCYNDWTHGTRGLSLAARMFYLELCLWSWDRQKPLPLNPETLASSIGVTAKEWATYWPQVESKFRRVKSGYWNPRVRRDIADFRQAQKARSVGGKIGAERRWKKPENPAVPHIPAAHPEPLPAPPPQTLAKVSVNPHHKPTNLINGASMRRHGTHAWCSFSAGRDGLCVPQFLHEELLGKSAKPDAELRAWYVSTVGALNGHAVGEDALIFWRNSFAGWVGTVTATPDTSSRTAQTLAGARRTMEKIQSGTREPSVFALPKVAKPS
jgi:uncharacterized protein YdaU (DUF1376 family)